MGFELIDNFEHIENNSELFIYGAGLAARRLFMDMMWKRPDIRIKGFIDSFMHSGELFTLPIINVADVKDIDKQQIVIASMHYEEIAEGLEERGVLNVLAYWKEVDLAETYLSLRLVDFNKVQIISVLPTGLTEESLGIINSHESIADLEKELPVLGLMGSVSLFPDTSKSSLDAVLQKIGSAPCTDVFLMDVNGDQLYLAELLRVLTSDYGKSVSLFKLPARTKKVSLIESRKIMFFEIAKNGSSSAVSLLEKLHAKYAVESDLYQNLRCRVDVTDPSFANYHKFAVVRNPYERLASLYAYIERCGSDFLFHGAFGKVVTPFTFNDFCRFVCNCSDEFADEHFISQTSFFTVPEGMLKGITMLHMENYAEEMKNFFTMIGEEVEAPHKNKSRPDSVNYIKDYYTPELIELVNRRYEQDFINFGYEFL
ncbi:sulfotransferase family 2 domain-containing protein [Maridesulfovibrio sp.]|uniref:sulfotransferase family 2 domain-containing protein n=1 Tax=Maridesulfovibrio sp. TaxID=2795000 RepID=UPI0029F54C5C|nr:sulfotransferase family 2 domain-containing protein [Maridesulfovibrio sp.]